MHYDFWYKHYQNVPWNELQQRYKYIEELGFDLVGLADHFVDWTNPQSPLVRDMDSLGGDCQGDYKNKNDDLRGSDPT